MDMPVFSYDEQYANKFFEIFFAAKQVMSLDYSDYEGWRSSALKQSVFQLLSRL